MRINRQRVPATGWRFKQGDILLHAKTWDELLTNVIAHRASNKLDLGNPAAEIEEQLIKDNEGLEVDQFKCIIKNGR